MNKLVTIRFVLIAFIVGAGIGAAATGGGGSTQTVTRTATQTVTVQGSQGSVTTQVSTTTITKTTSIVSTVTSLSAGTALVSYSGSGNANNPPFTATTATVKVSMNVTTTSGNPSLSGVSWYIYPTSSSSGYVTQCEVNGQSGSFSAFGYNLSPGLSYYVMVLSADANWQIIVQPMQ